jgi:histidinol-phosphate/aromatic aminotransferase/cobyric acid decarboxylase-like protein/SAM-dependent methyltransferase
MIPADPRLSEPARPPSGSRTCAQFARTGRWYVHRCATPGLLAPDEHERAVEHTAAEIAFCSRTLLKAAPGRRIADINCGLGDRAMGLAQAGFNVTAMDACATAIELARARSVRRGIGVDWLTAAASDGDEWPFDRVDAVTFMHSFGWGPEALQLRILRRIRRHLAEDGLLILERFPLWWDGHYLPAIQGETQFASSPGLRYDPVTGRVRTAIEFPQNGSNRSITYEFRHYSLPELTALVREAGFTIEEVAADLASGQPVTAESVRTEIVARRLRLPPASLAVADWGKQSAAELDLRYASDEAELLVPPPVELWRKLIQSTADFGAEFSGHYAVDDPYGGDRSAAVVAEHFGISLSPRQVTFAAGVSSFLQFLGGLADGGPIAASEFVHGDLEAWAACHGVEVQLIQDDDPARLGAALEAPQFSLLHLDRPTFSGRFLELDELEELVRLASAFGVVVVIDEAAAPYPGPEQSAVRLVNRVNNLAVLRGFTKAYSLGGLRAGLVVASPALAAPVRELVPPLQVGELALRAALCLLRAGDVFAPLRARIRGKARRS